MVTICLMLMIAGLLDWLIDYIDWLLLYLYLVPSPGYCHCSSKQGIARRNDTPSSTAVFDGGISMMQPPGECFWSGSGLVIVSATSVRPHWPVGSTSSIGFSYWCSIVTIALKCTSFEQYDRHETDRRTDGRTNGSQHCSVPLTVGRGHNNSKGFLSLCYAALHV